MLFEYTITETYKKTFQVEAETMEDALKIRKQHAKEYRRGDFGNIAARSGKLDACGVSQLRAVR